MSSGHGIFILVIFGKAVQFDPRIAGWLWPLVLMCGLLIVLTAIALEVKEALKRVWGNLLLPPAFLLFMQGLRGEYVHIPASMMVALVSLFLSHGVGFAFYVGQRKYALLEEGNIRELLLDPWLRLIILHIGIIGSCMLSDALGSPRTLLFIIVILKTAADTGLHLRESTLKAFRELIMRASGGTKKCELCGKTFSRSDTEFPVKSHVFCRDCYDRIRIEKEAEEERCKSGGGSL
jgi:hypothetical protein